MNDANKYQYKVINYRIKTAAKEITDIILSHISSNENN